MCDLYYFLLLFCILADPRHKTSAGMAGVQPQRDRDVLLRGRRPTNVQRYVSSSSAKRRQRKNDHCFFCVRYLNDAKTLEEHLRASSDCLACYCRSKKKRTLEGVLLEIFSCLICNNANTNSRLFYHLRSSPVCLDGYLEKFGADSLE